MEKVNTARKKGPSPLSVPPPAELHMDLFAPGMTMLHRAGLGGLACTLRHIETRREDGNLPDDQAPGGSWTNGTPPWQITPRTVTLRFGEPSAAREYLKRLFAIGLGLRDGLIYLPGQYEHAPPNQAVRADLQQGLLSTFLQHGRVRQLAAGAQVVEHDTEGAGVPGVRVQYRSCAGYTHQQGWEGMTDENSGWLARAAGEVSGPLSPGAVVRHVAFTADTRVENTPELLLPLYFALVGTLALPINLRRAALIVPQVEDLLRFICLRPGMTPTVAAECQIASAADGALQAQVRLRSRHLAELHELPGCLAMTFESTPWASQQRSRTATLMVPAGADLQLDRFEAALACLPPRIVVREWEEATGRGKRRTVTQHRDAFRTNSVVRPLVAENLARGRPWYSGFVRLMTALDDNNRPLRNYLRFEREGLHAMTDNPIMWDDAEATLVRAVHEALRCRYGRIAQENAGNLPGMRRRFQGEYDRRRLAFAGAKTPDQFRNALCDLFSRAGNNSILQQAWQSVLPLLADRRWQLARDLALLALASYSGDGSGTDTNELQGTSEEANA